jgi:hypothetical protein
MKTETLRTMVKGQPPEQLISELAEGSGSLSALHVSFRNVSSSIEILSVYERLKTPTLRFNVSLRAIFTPPVDAIRLYF